MPKSQRFEVGVSYAQSKGMLETGWYPSGYRSRSKRQLRDYATRFDLLEVGLSHLQLPTSHQCRSWAESVPKGFTFALQAYSAFTGQGLKASLLPPDLRFGQGWVAQRNLDPSLLEVLWQRYLEAIEPLKSSNKLGYLLFELPAFIAATPRVYKFLENLAWRTCGYTVAIGLHNPGWHRPSEWAYAQDAFAELGLLVVQELHTPRLHQASPLALLRCCDATLAQMPHLISKAEALKLQSLKVQVVLASPRSESAMLLAERFKPNLQAA